MKCRSFDSLSSSGKVIKNSGKVFHSSDAMMEKAQLSPYVAVFVLGTISINGRVPIVIIRTEFVCMCYKIYAKGVKLTSCTRFHQTFYFSEMRFLGTDPKASLSTEIRNNTYTV